MNVYTYFRWLSLDIVAGALLFLSYLEELYQVHLSFPVYLALGSAVWLIYTTDHLLDSFKCPDLSQRRAFHRRNSKILILSGSIVLVGALINVFFLPEKIIRAGALLAAGCIAYLVIIYFLKKVVFKEMIVALGYAIGLFLPPLVKVGMVHSWDIFFILQLTLIAFCNLIIFSFFDEEEDRNHQFYSVVILLGRRRSGILIYSTLVINLLLILTVFIYIPGYFSSIQLIYGLMTLTLMVIFSFQDFFGTNERFRLVGDGIFFLPLLFL